MPYVQGKLKGQLTAPELRRMIKLHNKMVGITIPTGSKRDDLIKIIESNGFKIDHAKQKLIPTSKKMIRKNNVPLPPPVKRKAKAKKSEPSIDDEIAKLMKSSDKLDKKSKPKAKKPNIDDEINNLMKISDELEAKKKAPKPKKTPVPKKAEEPLKSEFKKLLEANKELLLSMKMSGAVDNRYEYFLSIVNTTSEDKLSPKLKILKANIKPAVKKPKKEYKTPSKGEIFKDNITPEKEDPKWKIYVKLLNDNKDKLMKMPRKIDNQNKFDNQYSFFMNKNGSKYITVNELMKLVKEELKEKPVPKGSHRMPDGSIMKDKDMKSAPKDKKEPEKDNEKNLKYLQKVTLKFIEDHKEWLLPARKSGADNGYEYYMNMFNKDMKSIKELKFLIYFLENEVEGYKTGTNARGVINPFNKKNKPVRKMPKASYELYQKIKNL